MSSFSRQWKCRNIWDIFSLYGGHWNWERLCDLTEPIADKIEKYIIVEIDPHGNKQTVVPPRECRLYHRYISVVRFKKRMPYEYDYNKICSMTEKNAQGYMKHMMSCLRPKRHKLSIERLDNVTLF